VSVGLPIDQLVRSVNDVWECIKLKVQTDPEGPGYAVPYMWE